MPQAIGERTWKIPNKMGPATFAAREAAEWVESFSVPEQSSYAIRLTIEEMLTNTIKYGYKDAADHLIDVHLAADGKTVRIDLLDDAIPFNPTLQPEPDVQHNIDDGVEGGLGIELVRCICQRIDYHREGNLNHITLFIGISDPNENSGGDPAAPEPSKEFRP